MKYTYLIAILCAFILHAQSLNSNIVERRGLEQQMRVKSHSTSSTSSIMPKSFSSFVDSIMSIGLYISHTFGSSSSSATPPLPTIIHASSESHTVQPLSSIPSSLPVLAYKTNTFGSSSTTQTSSTSVTPLSTIHGNLPSYISHTHGSSSMSSHYNKVEEGGGAIHVAQYHMPVPSISMSPAQMIQVSKNNQHQKAVSDVSAQPSNNVVVIEKQIAVTATDPNEMRMPPCYRNGRKVPFSNYWIPKENEWDETNDGERVYLGGNAKMKLVDKNNQELGMVPVDMYPKCKMEGTCLLENGDLINIDNSTDTFIKVGKAGREHNVFGLGAGVQNLVPFVSVAANDIPLGQTLYIKELDGQDLGYGMKHNGCVRVDDDSWSFDSCQIDFFVLSYVDYLWLDLDDEVAIEYANCQLKNYVTKQHMHFAKASPDEKIIPSLLYAKYIK